jgi:hypothetical protein
MLVATGTIEMAADLRAWAAARHIDVAEIALDGGTHVNYRTAAGGAWAWAISLVVEVPRCR